MFAELHIFSNLASRILATARTHFSREIWRYCKKNWSQTLWFTFLIWNIYIYETTLFLPSPVTAISVVRNCCTTIMRLSYNLFSMKLDMYSFEYRNLMWIWEREEELYAFSLFFSSPRDKAKNDNAKSNTCEWDPMTLKEDQCECMWTTKRKINYLSFISSMFHHCVNLMYEEQIKLRK